MTLTTPAAFETVPLDTALRPAEFRLQGVAHPRLRAGAPRRGPAEGFHAPGADDHVRLFFAPADGPLPATPEEWRELPSREYTPLNADPVAGWVEFDLVVHGDGPGSEWAATAPPGSRVAVAGPRRSNAITGDPDAWFLAGDETAIPAITRFLRSRRPGTPARVIVEVAPRTNSSRFPRTPAPTSPSWSGAPTASPTPWPRWARATVRRAPCSASSRRRPPSFRSPGRCCSSAGRCLRRPWSRRATGVTPEPGMSAASRLGRIAR